MINPDVLAYIATVLNVLMLLPQVLRAWKTKKTKDLSATTLIMFSVACCLWVIYGIAKEAPPVVIANTVGAVMNIILLILKFGFKSK